MQFLPVSRKFVGHDVSTNRSYRRDNARESGKLHGGGELLELYVYSFGFQVRLSRLYTSRSENLRMTRVLLYIDICEDVRQNNWTLRVNEFCIRTKGKSTSKDISNVFIQRFKDIYVQ